MKVLFVFFLLVAVALAVLSPEQIAKIEPISKKCREKTGVTVEQVNKMRQQLVPEDDSKLKKHLLCMSVKTGVMSESGDINTNAIKEKLNKAGASVETVKSIEKKCFVKKDTPEDTAFELARCVAKNQSNYSPAD